MAKMPPWYGEYHSLLVKNFNLPDNEYESDRLEADEFEEDVDEEEFDELLVDIPLSEGMDGSSLFRVGDLVRHKKFGDGTVALVEGNKLEVYFAAGVKRVMDAFVTRLG